MNCLIGRFRRSLACQPLSRAVGVKPAPGVTALEEQWEPGGPPLLQKKKKVLFFFKKDQQECGVKGNAVFLKRLNVAEPSGKKVRRRLVPGSPALGAAPGRREPEPHLELKELRSEEGRGCKHGVFLEGSLQV